jgi:ADP-heptose:LPS heptosyltransferase
MTRVAVIRALALGDMLCAVPALRAIRTAFPDATISLIGLPWAAAFVERFRAFIDDFIEFPGFPGIPEVPLDAARTVAFLGEIQRQRYDLALQLQGNGLAINEFVALIGATRLAGFVPPGLEPPRDVAGDLWLPYPDHGTEVDRLLALAVALGAPVERRLEFPVHDADRLGVDAILRACGVVDGPLAVVHPGGSRPERRWPAERFARVADALSDDGLAVVLTGTAGEGPVTSAVHAAMGRPAVDLAGRTSLGEIAALIERARIVVTNDTGVSHLAAAVGGDSVTVFSASDRERWAPAGTDRNLAVGAGVRDGTDGHVDVPVADVLAATRRLLAGRTASGIGGGRRRSPR